MSLYLFKKTFSVLLIAFALALPSQASNIIPEPLSITTKKGSYKLSKKIKISTNSKLKREAKFLKKYLSQDFKSKATISKAKTAQILLAIDATIDHKEGYKIDINKRRIKLSGKTKAGVFYAIQSLRQLLLEHGNKLPLVKIEDRPRYSFRSLMLDPARHFIAVKDVKKFIDIMAYYKYNTLHLHLCDDQGWRIESKKYPKLTTIGSKRKETEGDGKAHGGFYTQKDLKSIVAYAKRRHIEVMPEIDLPGHSVAIIASYPEFNCFPKKLEVRTIPGVSKDLMCAGNKNVYKFYEDILAEVAAIFPCKTIHLGGDEAPLDHWKKCPKCQKTMKKEKLANTHKLMAHFFSKINQILVKHGKVPMLWFEEGDHSYPKNSAVVMWRPGSSRRVLQKSYDRGLKLVVAPDSNCYFDYPQTAKDKKSAPGWMPVTTLRKTYQLDPGFGVPAKKQSHVIGVEGTLWGEQMKTLNKIVYMAFPRAMALSEAGWSEMKNRSWEKFEKKLPQHIQRLNKQGFETTR